MKKLFAILLALCMVLALCACGAKDEASTAAQSTETAADTAEKTEEVAEAPAETETEPAAEADAEPSSEPEETASDAISYADFVAAELDTEVIVEGAVQLAAFNAEYGNICLFLQNEDGAYYIYRMNATEDDAAALVPGAMIRVTGYKAEWSGEVEITDASYELIDGSYIAEAKDITDTLASDNLIDDINKFIAIKGAVVSVAPMYNWDGSGEKGSDIYVTFTVGEADYTFLVESDEFGVDSDIYAFTEGLQVGDAVNIEGFLYWYNGAQIHMSSIAMAGK